MKLGLHEHDFFLHLAERMDVHSDSFHQLGHLPSLQLVNGILKGRQTGS